MLSAYNLGRPNFAELDSHECFAGKKGPTGSSSNDGGVQLSNVLV